MICRCSDIENKEDRELLKIEKNENVLEQQNIISNYFEQLDKYQKLKIEKNENEKIYFFKESYKNAKKCLQLFNKNYKSFMNNNFSLSAIKKFIDYLSENLNIETNNLEFLNRLLIYDYHITYFRLIKNLFHCNKNKQIFNNILNIKVIENKIDICFYELTKLFIESPKNEQKDNFNKDLSFLKSYYNTTINNCFKTNKSEMIQNNTLLYLFSPYFLSYYIYYSFVEIYLNDILIFLKKYANTSIINLDYKFRVENIEKDKYFLILKNKLEDITISLSIEKINNDEIQQTGYCFSIIDLKVIFEKNKIFINPALLTKDSLKSIFKENSELLNSYDNKKDKK